MKVSYSLVSLIWLLGVSSMINAAVLPDRTRLVLNETDKSVSVRLTNKSETPLTWPSHGLRIARVRKHVILSLRCHRYCA